MRRIYINFFFIEGLVEHCEHSPVCGTFYRHVGQRYVRWFADDGDVERRL